MEVFPAFSNRVEELEFFTQSNDLEQPLDRLSKSYQAQIAVDNLVGPYQNVNAARIYKAQALAINQQMFGRVPREDLYVRSNQRGAI
ncbi:MAG TPA: hypothetical protein VJ935_07710 [Acidimicrobiia bacterium]|nr:hypothetical protein [Acidimicrobiia bacterium]